MASRRVRVVVRGKVQGVFYRVTCARVARELGITGWVRNNPDGSVEAVFSGDAKKVSEMIKWSRKGPEFARVDSVDVHELEDGAEPELDFRIL